MMWSRALALTAMAVAAGTAMGLAAPWWWIAELTTHWAPQAALVSFVAAALATRHAPRLAGAAIALTVLALMPVVSRLWRPRAPETGPGPHLTVAHGNLFFGSHGPLRRAGLAALTATDADILTLAEALDDDRSACPTARWPYQIWQAQPSRPHWDQLVLLSRYPILHWHAEDLDSQPFIVATLAVQGRVLHVIAAHVPSPDRSRNAWAREAQFRHMAAAVQRLVTTDPAPVLALGDFNSTTHSPWWEPLTTAGLLTAVHEPATWYRPLGAAGIAIDHILGRDLAIAPPRIIDLPDSDHRGLVTRVSVLR